jgi:hypothetical protein
MQEKNLFYLGLDRAGLLFASGKRNTLARAYKTVYYKQHQIFLSWLELLEVVYLPAMVLWSMDLLLAGYEWVKSST